MNKSLKKRREKQSTTSFLGAFSCLILPHFFGRRAGIDASTSRTHLLTRQTAGPDATTTAQQRMASTLPVRTHRHTGHAMAASASPAVEHSPQRDRCRQGRSTTEAGRRRHPRHARSADEQPARRGSTYDDDEDSAGPASPASSSADARAAAAACWSCACRVTAAACSDRAFACHATTSPRRRTSRSSSSLPRRASRSASAAFSRSRRAADWSALSRIARLWCRSRSANTRRSCSPWTSSPKSRDELDDENR
jgi:hypothetical protein